MTLPGGDGATIEVGSGAHRWSAPYAEPAARRVPVSLDSPVGELLDDPLAWPRVREILARRAPDLIDHLEGGGMAASGMSLRRIVGLRPAAGPLSAELAAVLAEVGP